MDVILPQIPHRGFHQVSVVTVQHFAQCLLGRHAGAEAIQNAFHITHSVRLNDVFHIGERPGVRIPRRTPIQTGPGPLQLA